MHKVLRGSLASYALALYEPPSAIHSTSRNPSTDQRVKLLVFMVADQKNPTTVPE